MKVNILGTEYEIIKQTKSENSKLNDNWGYTEPYSKKIILDNDIGHDKSNDSAERQDLFAEKVLRHEIIHAFFTESGLRENCDYATSEELVDWIAIQFPKIEKVLEQIWSEKVLECWEEQAR